MTKKKTEQRKSKKRKKDSKIDTNKLHYKERKNWK